VKKLAIFILALLLTGVLYSQEKPEIQDGISFRYIGMEFSGSHSRIPEKVPAFLKEIHEQKIQSDVVGDLFGVFFDSPLLTTGRRPVYALGVRIEKDLTVKMPLLKLLYEYDQVATIIHHGPYETAANAFNIILPFIEEKELEIAGPYVVIWMGNPRHDKPEDLKTKIIIPVKGKNK
jgi:effector-binding domain-containing protein